jgi:hypothetical protein
MDIKLVDSLRGLTEQEETLASVWFDYKQGQKPEVGKKLLNYLREHPEEAKRVAGEARRLVQGYKYLYRVGDNTGLSWTPDKQILKDYFPDEERLYKIKVTPAVIDRVVGHELTFPLNSFTKYAPENEFILTPLFDEEEE